MANSLNDLLGDAMMTMGLKQAQKQTLGAMKTHAPPPQRPTPAGSAPVGNATPAFGYGAPGAAAAPRTDVNMFAPPPSAPMGGLQPGGAAGFANAVAGGLDDLLGGMNLGARQNTSGSNAMGMAQQQPAAQKGLDALDSFFGARPAAAAPPMQAADPFAAVATPAAAAAAAPAPAAGGIDAFDDFFAGSRPAAAPTPSKPTPVISPPQAAAPVSPAKPAGGDDFDLFARGGEAPPAQPQPSVAPPTQVGSPPPAAAPEDFDFFAGGAPAAAPATPANHQPSFDSLDALGSIGGSAVKKGASVDPLDNIMGWGAAPAQTQPQTVVAPRAQGAQPDLFGTHVSAAQVAAVQAATAGDLFDDADTAVDPNEPEERKLLRLKRIEAKRARVAERLREKLELDARQAAEHEEEDQLRDIVGARLETWKKMGKGNIRAYLTTVQEVLWDGNTWKPITLMDLVSVDQVRKAWNKVLINIHPDKVQQKGGTIAQRYVADKVFHVMLDAYNTFRNKEGLA